MKYSILYVDDDKYVAQLGKRFLEKQGYKVTLKYNGTDALKAFSEHPEFFDLAITDQTMPGLTGHKFAEKMLDIRPDFPIILATGYSDIISEKESKKLGIKKFLLKPMELRELAQTVRTLLDCK
ncbi:MAG: response regulator [Bacteroidetes bacterium]|nr:response regulator [Bacteroidota bacterium]